MKAFLLLCLVAFIATCTGFKFTSDNADVLIGSGPVRTGVTVIADTNAEQQEIIFPFGVTEYEVYDEFSRLQTCPNNGCSNYLMSYAMADYSFRGNQIGSETVAGIFSKKYRYTDTDGIEVTLWVDNSDDNRIVQVSQSGGSINRQITFNSYTFNVANFDSVPSDPNCATVQCNDAVELVLVIDSSGSISPTNYTVEMNFAKDLVNQFVISDTAVRVSVITFASNAAKRLQLSGDQSEIENILTTTAQQGGQTNIGEAIEFARDELIQNGRSGVPSAILVITDGVANEPASGDPINYMIQQAELAKGSPTNSLIYAIGVGNFVAQSNLEDIASSPTEDFTAKVNDFDELVTLISGIQGEFCTGDELQDTCSPNCGDDYFCGCTECQCALDASICGDHGSLNTETCSCECDSPFTGDTCSVCNLNCNGNGDPNDDCSACECDNNYTSADNCFSCGLNCVNGSPDGNCDECICENMWEGDDCSSCTRNVCNDNGDPNGDCSSCECDTNYSGTTCTSCDLDCNGLSPIDDCTACGCTGALSGPNCEICDESVCENGSTMDDCSVPRCNCPSSYTGNTCSECKNKWQLCNGNGDVGSPEGGCQCSCYNDWDSADNCATCTWECVNGNHNNECTGCNCSGDWGGDLCNECNLSCQNGGTKVEDVDNGICECDCPDRYKGDTCGQCKNKWQICNGNGDVGSAADGCQCSCYNNWNPADDCDTCLLNCIHGDEDDDCSECECNGGWEGTDCNDCLITCEYGGTLDDTDDCECHCTDRYQGDTCSECKNKWNLCNGRGDVGSPEGGCQCSCYNDWDSADDCATCTWECVNGNHNNECTGCNCSGNWDGDLCNECNLSCQNGGTKVEDVDNGICECQCIGDYDGTVCSECSNSCNSHGSPDPSNNCGCVCDNENWDITDNCLTCTLDCGVNGSPNSDCEFCECTYPYDGSDCSECSLTTADCNGYPVNDADGNCECSCSYPFEGTSCESCIYECNNGNVSNESECNSCDCNDGYTEDSDCFECDNSDPSDFCNGNGYIDPDSNCDSCICYENLNFYGTNCENCDGSFCGVGSVVDETTCDECSCPGYLDPSDGCQTCLLVCENGGSPNDDCTACDCTGGYSSDSNCGVCDPNGTYLANECNNNPDGLDENCECICSDEWSGTNCDVCDLSDCQAPYGSQINYSINGVPQCRCECRGFYEGENCLECGLSPDNNPATGRICDGNALPEMTDCSCHCREYYADIEGCDICILTDEDCVNPDGPADTSSEVCTCDCADYWDGIICDICILTQDDCVHSTDIFNEDTCDCVCDGNWGGQICDICTLTPEDCDEPNGWYLDDTICECITICDDGIIAGDEECELALMPPEHQDCCTNCYYTPSDHYCDDFDECTLNDKCNRGVCSGNPKVCAQGDCFESICNSDTGKCERSFVDNTCSDNSLCTENDHCDPETLTCVGEDIICNESGHCDSVGICHPTAGCIYGAANCPEPGNCQISVCDANTGDCGFEDVFCSDEDDNLCTTHSCNAVTGLCESSDIVCSDDDDNKCTVSTCSFGQCVVSETLCPNEVGCQRSTCDIQTGECLAPIDICPTSNDACFVNECNVESGSCVAVPAVDCGALNTECHTYQCVNGECQLQEKLTCSDDDDDLCSEPICNDSGVCEQVDITCSDDNDLCTENACVNGVCQVVSTKTCPDIVNCQEFSCSPSTGECDNLISECVVNDVNNLASILDAECIIQGCVDNVCISTPVAITCSDEDDDLCTIPVCKGGNCVNTNPECLEEDDDDACTTRVCDSTTGDCNNENNGSCTGAGPAPPEPEGEQPEPEEPAEEIEEPEEPEEPEFSTVGVVGVGGGGSAGAQAINNEAEGVIASNTTTVGAAAIGGGIVVGLIFLAGAFGLNSTKEDPVTPLNAVLGEEELVTEAYNNPLSHDALGANINVLGA